MLEEGGGVYEGAVVQQEQSRTCTSSFPGPHISRDMLVEEGWRLGHGTWQ